MIGAEFAGRLGPLAPRPPVLSPFDDNDCPVCGAAHSTCTSNPQPEPEPLDVEALVTERAAQQVKRGPGRPPKDPEKRAAKEAAHASAVAVEALGAPVETVARSGVPAGDPVEVRDLFVVPEGVISPEDDPHRPSRKTTVLVSEPSQLQDTGAWMTLPGGQKIATTRDVLRVFWAMGTRSPSYAMVAPRGAVLPKAAR